MFWESHTQVSGDGLGCPKRENLNQSLDRERRRDVDPMKNQRRISPSGLVGLPKVTAVCRAPQPTDVTLVSLSVKGIAQSNRRGSHWTLTYSSLDRHRQRKGRRIKRTRSSHRFSGCTMSALDLAANSRVGTVVVYRFTLCWWIHSDYDTADPIDPTHSIPRCISRRFR